MGVTLGVLPLLAYSYGKGDRQRLMSALRASGITVGVISGIFTFYWGQFDVVDCCTGGAVDVCASASEGVSCIGSAPTSPGRRSSHMAGCVPMRIGHRKPLCERQASRYYGGSTIQPLRGNGHRSAIPRGTSAIGLTTTSDRATGVANEAGHAYFRGQPVGSV